MFCFDSPLLATSPIYVYWEVAYVISIKEDSI